MKVYKFVNAYEKDGMTVKENRFSMPYSGYRGLTMEEKIPIEVGSFLDMRTTTDKSNHDSGYFKSSTIEDIKVTETQMLVTTNNSIYEFEIIDR